MPQQHLRHRYRRMLLDPDMMGFGSAAFFGTLAMALGFWRQLDGFTVAVRVGLTALVAYAATFLCARYLRGVGDRLAREEQRRLEEERRARAAEAAREKGEEA